MASKKTPDNNTAKNNTIDFEQQLSQLEILVSEMEKGDMSLEDSLKAFEQGIKITRECQQALKAAEQKVAILTRNADGEFDEQAFEPEQ